MQINPNNRIGFCGVRLPVKTYGEVSLTFVREMKSGLKEFPDVITAKLKRQELLDEIRLAPKASEAYPDSPSLQIELKTHNCTGTQFKWDEILSGIANSKKTFYGKNLEIVGFFEKPTYIEAQGANKGSVGHELSHKVDELLKKAIGIIFAHTEGFKEVVKKDLAKLPERKKLYSKEFEKYGHENLKYMTQKSTPEHLDSYGLGEIFANCGASLTTGVSGELDKNIKFIEKFFPESRAYVEKFFYLLGMR